MNEMVPNENNYRHIPLCVALSFLYYSYSYKEEKDVILGEPHYQFPLFYKNTLPFHDCDVVLNFGHKISYS